MSTARKCKTKYLAKSAFIYTAVSICLILSARMLFAQQAQRTIIISPPSVERTVDPGDTSERTIKITNSSADTINFKSVVRDFVVDNPDGIPHILVGETLSAKYSASAWLGVSPNSFSLAPGKTQEVTYYLQVPKDARPGGHYAAVMYEPQEPLATAGTGAGVETHIGTLFYIHVKGNIVENATVKSFTSSFFHEYGPVTIYSQVANYSDTDIRPTGFVTVKNILGQEVYKDKYQELNIYPEAVRNYTNSIGRKYMFGPYTAELHATYGTNNNLTLYASTTFLVLPWKIITIVVLIIIAVILFAIWWRRKKKKDAQVEHQGTPEQPAVHNPAPPAV